MAIPKSLASVRAVDPSERDGVCPCHRDQISKAHLWPYARPYRYPCRGPAHGLCEIEQRPPEREFGFRPGMGIGCARAATNAALMARTLSATSAKVDMGVNSQNLRDSLLTNVKKNAIIW